MDDKLPEGSLFKVTLELRLPVAATDEQIREWAHYVICDTGGCSLENPLINFGPEEWASTFEIEDTGMVGTIEKFDHWSKPDGSRGCRVRYRRERRAA